MVRVQISAKQPTERPVGRQPQLTKAQRALVLVKAFLAGLLLWTAGTANAASPLDQYLITRDRYIADLNRDVTAGNIDTVSKQDDHARGALEAMLKAMIGPVTVKGFPAEGRINLQTLVKELGFGMLDGLAHGSPDNERVVVVTTGGLLRAWLKTHKNWWPGRRTMPQDIKGALRWEEFYTQAVISGSAIARFAEIPVAAPAKAGAVFAMLAIARQDIGPTMPDRIILSVVRGDRVFVVVEPSTVAIEPIPACSALWQRYDQARQRAFNVFQASRESEATRDALFAKATKLEADGDVAHRRCFAEHVKEQSYFPAVIRQTQALVDSLP